MIQHLARGLALDQAAGRAALAKAVSEKIRKIPEGFLTDILWQRLSELVKLPMARLKGRELAVSARPKTLRVHTPLRKALMLLLQYPGFVDALHQDIEHLPEDPPFDEVWHAVVTRLRLETTSSAALLEDWREHPHAKVLHALCMHEHGLSVDQAREEFLGAIKKLSSESQKAYAESLLWQAKVRELTKEEKETLVRLLREKS